MRILSSQGNTAYLGGCLTTPYGTIPPMVQVCVSQKYQVLAPISSEILEQKIRF